MSLKSFRPNLACRRTGHLADAAYGSPGISSPKIFARPCPLYRGSRLECRDRIHGQRASRYVARWTSSPSTCQDQRRCWIEAESMSSVDVRREPHGRMNCTIEPAHSATRPSIVPTVCAHTDAVTAILNFGPLPKARIWPILRPISQHCDSENGRQRGRTRKLN